MSGHEIMGAGGVETDMISGQPRVLDKASEDKTTEAIFRYKAARQESLALEAELQQSPTLRTLLDQYSNRLTVLASQDHVCQALETVIKTMNIKLIVAPMEAEKYVRRIMGPRLVSIMDVTSAAPEGIPADE